MLPNFVHSSHSSDYTRWISTFHDLSASGEHITRFVSRKKASTIFFFFSGSRISSVVVLRPCAHSTSRNTISVAAPQRTGVVYAGLLFQSLHPYNRQNADCRIISHSTKHRGASVVPDLPSLTHLRTLTEHSCKLPECTCPDGGMLITPY